MKEISLAVQVGQAIRALREATGLSQDRFADRIALHRAYYAAIELGEKNITLPTLKRVADGLGMRIATVLEDIDR